MMMIWIFYIFSALLVWLSYKSFLGGVEYLRYFREELSKPYSEWEPMVTVVAPCKGVDEGMSANLEALFQQDLPEYEVVFVIDDEEDPVMSVIEDAAARAGQKAKIIIAPKAEGSSQKVENLREGVLHADEKSEVFVFVDSDARPSCGWLRALVAPLKDGTVGATTGYRWFLSANPSLASELRSAWNASIASALGPKEKSNFCWGGSTAMRRDMFERLQIREKWQGTLSDDFTVTRVIRDTGLRTRFVPQALSASVESCTLRELFEFTNRQMKITRVYMPHLWMVSFFGSGLFCTVMMGSFFLFFIVEMGSITFWVSLATLSLVTLFSVGKAWLRLRAASMVLTPYAGLVKRQKLPQLTLWLISPLVFLINCVAALLSRKVNWRGHRYEMVSSTETRQL